MPARSSSPHGHKPRRPRVLKSVKQRAEEALAVAERAEARAAENLKAARAMVQAAEERHAGAAALLRHAKSHPALGQAALPLDAD